MKIDHYSLSQFIGNKKQLYKLYEAIENDDVFIWNKWINENQEEIDLRGADLRQAFLVHALFKNANLEKANFGGANLTDAYFENSNMRNIHLTVSILASSQILHCNLNRSTCIRADFSNSKIENSSLQSTKLNGVNFSQAIFNNVKMHGAQFGSTILTNTNLSQISGLEETLHINSSYIDFHTIQKSQSKIPEAFLIGCGFTNSFIQSLITDTCEYTFFVEGPTDEKYLNLVLNTFDMNDLKIKVVWIGRINSQGSNEFTGETALTHTKNFFLANPDFLKNKRLILLYDSDTKIKEENYSQLFARKMSLNSNNNTFKKGIENLLTIPADFTISDCYNNKEHSDDYGGKKIITQLDKMKLCEKIFNLTDDKIKKTILKELRNEFLRILDSLE